MPGLIDDSLQAGAQAVSGMEAATEDAASKYVQDLARKQAGKEALGALAGTYIGAKLAKKDKRDPSSSVPPVPGTPETPEPVGGMAGPSLPAPAAASLVGTRKDDDGIGSILGGIGKRLWGGLLGGFGFSMPKDISGGDQ